MERPVVFRGNRRSSPGPASGCSSSSTDAGLSDGGRTSRATARARPRAPLDTGPPVRRCRGPPSACQAGGTSTSGLPPSGRVFRGARRVHLGRCRHPGELRLEALARYLQDVATDDADDARLSEHRGGWVLRSSDLEITGCPCTTKSSSWRRSAAASARAGPSDARHAVRFRRPSGDGGALGVHRPRAVVARSPSTTTSTPSTASRGGRRSARSAGARSAGAMRGVRSWSLRESDFDVLDHVNNARSLEAVEDELASGSRHRVARPSSSTAAPSNAATASTWRATCARSATGCRAGGVARGRRRGAGVGDVAPGRRPVPRREGPPYTDRALDPMPVESFAGRRCIVTGGLGFIGSNLALALAAAGADVTVIDAPVPRHGANPANLVPDGDASPTRGSPWSKPTSATSRADVRGPRPSAPTSCSTSPGR